MLTTGLTVQVTGSKHWTKTLPHAPAVKVTGSEALPCASAISTAAKIGETKSIARLPQGPVGTTPGAEAKA